MGGTCYSLDQLVCFCLERAFLFFKRMTDRQCQQFWATFKKLFENTKESEYETWEALQHSLDQSVCPLCFVILAGAGGPSPRAMLPVRLSVLLKLVSITCWTHTRSALYKTLVFFSFVSITCRTLFLIPPKKRVYKNIYISKCGR